MWVLDSPLNGDIAGDIDLDEKSSNAALSSWAEELTTAEAQRLNASGLRALPLKVRRCGSLSMCKTGSKPKEVHRIAFNRANVATTFDFGQILSIEIGSMDQDAFSAPDGTMYFCVICLLRVRRDTAKSPTVGGKEIIIIFPYLFKDPRNPLTHWAFVNSKDQPHYLVRQSIRHGSAVVPGQTVPVKQVSPSPVCDKLVQGVRLGYGGSDRVRQEWATHSAKQRSEWLSFDNIDIFERTLANMNALFASSTCTAADISEKLKAFPLLASLEFQKKCVGNKVMSISTSILQDGNDFLAILEQWCPKLLSGKLRCRCTPSKWSALLGVSYSRDATCLQQRIAQLIEQKLWVLADVPVIQVGQESGIPTREPPEAAAAGKRRRHRKKKSGCCKETEGHGPEAPSTPETKFSVAPPKHEELEVEAAPAAVGQAGVEVEEAALLRQCVDEPCQEPSQDSKKSAAAEGISVSLANRPIVDKVSPNHSTSDGSHKVPSLGKFDDIGEIRDVSLTDWLSHDENDPILPISTANQAVDTSMEPSSLAFKQPPGLEFDAATLVERLVLRNIQLEEHLEKAGLKIPFTKLMADSVLGA